MMPSLCASTMSWGSSMRVGEVLGNLAGHVVALDGVDDGVLVGVLLLGLLVVALDQGQDLVVGGVGLAHERAGIAVGDVVLGDLKRAVRHDLDPRPDPGFPRPDSARSMRPCRLSSTLWAACGGSGVGVSRSSSENLPRYAGLRSRWHDLDEIERLPPSRFA